MTDPTTPDTLTAAAGRAETHQEKRQRLATQAADWFVHDHKTIVCQEYRHDRCAYGKHPDAQECLCECHDEPEPGPAPASAVDLEELSRIAHGPQRPVGVPTSPWQEVEDALGRLLDAGYVTTRARVAEREGDDA